MMLSLSLSVCGADSIIKYFVPSQSQITRVDDVISFIENQKQVHQLEKLKEMLGGDVPPLFSIIYTMILNLIKNNQTITR